MRLIHMDTQSSSTEHPAINQAKPLFKVYEETRQLYSHYQTRLTNLRSYCTQHFDEGGLDVQAEALRRSNTRLITYEQNTPPAEAAQVDVEETLHGYAATTAASVRETEVVELTRLLAMITALTTHIKTDLGTTDFETLVQGLHTIDLEAMLQTFREFHRAAQESHPLLVTEYKTLQAKTVRTIQNEHYSQIMRHHPKHSEDTAWIDEATLVDRIWQDHLTKLEKAGYEAQLAGIEISRWESRIKHLKAYLSRRQDESSQDLVAVGMMMQENISENVQRAGQVDISRVSGVGEQHDDDNDDDLHTQSGFELVDRLDHMVIDDQDEERGWGSDEEI